MKPYSFRDQTRKERAFSYRLSRARRTVEGAFSILANRFRVLGTANALDPPKAEKIVLACVVLHNFLRRHNVLHPCRETQSEQEAFVNVVRGEDELLTVTRARGVNHTTEAKRVREEYTRYFNHEGAVSWQHNNR